MRAIWKQVLLMAGISLAISLVDVIMIYLSARYGRLWIKMVVRPGNSLFPG